MSHDNERYLGSSDRDFLRHKDHSSKWSHGVRSKDSNSTINRNEWELYADAKIRPQKKNSEILRKQPKLKLTKGIIRIVLPESSTPTRKQKKVGKVSDEDCTGLSSSALSLSGMCPFSVSGPAGSAATSPRGTADAGVYYSYDCSQLPNRPLPLETFVKTDERATEKFVEREYEVLDRNGDAVRGRRARKTLRQKGGTGEAEYGGLAAKGEDGWEDDDFEFV